MLTLEVFNKFENGIVMEMGIIRNNPEGVYMTDTRIGDRMLWYAKKGHGNDWCIYIGWEEWGGDRILTNGDKVRTQENIRKLVKCTDEVYKLYRH